MFTETPGSSLWFVEGAVTYSNDAKINRLQVPRHSRAFGAVSEACVEKWLQEFVKRQERHLGSRLPYCWPRWR